ncbi:flavin reductase family protein [Streptomyces sp. NPDC001493]
MEPDLRTVMRHFATGVGVVSVWTPDPSAGGGRRYDAVTVNSLAPVSWDPPLVSLCLRHDSAFLADLLKAGEWAVSILGADGAATAGRLARPREKRSEALAELPSVPGEHTGALVFEGAGWLECSLTESFTAGDHLMVIGRVLATGVTPSRSRLVFLNGVMSPAPAAG